MKVRYTRTALDELNEIFAYLADRNIAAASLIVTRVETLVGFLADFPYMAQETEMTGVRRLPLGVYPYNIFYVAEDDEIVILHIRHGARRFPWVEP